MIRGRDTPEKVDVYQLDISQTWALALSDQFILELRNIVYVTAALEPVGVERSAVAAGAL